jgi:hypothetical protein
MQLKKSAILVAAACAAMAGSANAAMSDAEKAIVKNATDNSRVIFISGASAVQSGFTSIIGTLFTGTPIRFSNTTASSKDFEAVAGTLATGTGDWAGKNVIIIYRTKGGSVWGVNPVARATNITALNVTETTCGTAGSGTAELPYTCSTIGDDVNNVGVTPDAGVSDVAPNLFKFPYNTEGEVSAAELTQTELDVFEAGNGGSKTGIYGLSFGVAVTKNVGAVKITRSDVAAIFTGNVSNWSALGDTAGDIVVCRRVPGSGTQAVFNMWAGNFPCGTFNKPADRDASGAWDPVARKFTAANGAGGLIVIENSTSGDVRNCLTMAVDGGTYATKDRDGVAVAVDFGTGGYKAIGTLSMDSLTSSKTTSKWQFRSLDGAGTITLDNSTNGSSPATSGTGKFPTAAVYENGDWDLQGWVSFNIPGRTTGAKRAVLDKFLVNAQNPTVLAGSNSLKHVAMGIPESGYTGAQVLDAEYLNGDQCAPYNRNYND